jgi:hypothetical protein
MRVRVAEFKEEVIVNPAPESDAIGAIGPESFLGWWSVDSQS